MAFQPIIIGTADAKAGDTLFDGATKVNDNFAELYSVSTITRRVVVNSISDLPTAVSGVITLADNTLYLQSDDVSISTSRFLMGQNTVYSGIDSLVVELSYVGTLPLFTFIDATGSVKDIKITHPNSPLFSFSDSGSNVLRVSDVSYNGSSIGSFGGTNSGMRMTNFSGSSSLRGISFTGNWRAFLFEPSLSSLSSGVFIDLGVATFDSISVSETTLNYAAGSFFLSGVVNSGNINSGGLGLIASSQLTGGGTPLQQISPTDSSYVFSHNNAIRDSKPDGLLSMQGNASATPITVIDTPVLAVGAWVVDETSQFTGTVGGRLTYNADNDVRLPILFSVSLSPVLSTGISMSAYIAINGSIVTQSRRQGTGSANGPTSITLPWQHTFETGDYVEVWVSNDSNTTNVLVSSAIARVN